MRAVLEMMQRGEEAERDGGRINLLADAIVTEANEMMGEDVALMESMLPVYGWFMCQHQDVEACIDNLMAFRDVVNKNLFSSCPLKQLGSPVHQKIFFYLFNLLRESCERTRKDLLTF